MKKWTSSRLTLLLTPLLTLSMVSIGAWAQQDPGPRTGPATAGGQYPTLNANEQAFFSQAFLRFQEVDTVTGTSTGLGPTFNGKSGNLSHRQRPMGGPSPDWTSPQNPFPNPRSRWLRLTEPATW